MFIPSFFDHFRWIGGNLMCVLVWDRGWSRKAKRRSGHSCSERFVCVCVCVRERERERQSDQFFRVVFIFSNSIMN